MTTPTEICERLDVTDREATVTDDQIKYMVERFLQWRLPENFSPDCGISFQADYNNVTAHPARHEPRGTNLFDFTQAREMVRFMIDGMDVAANARALAAEAALEKMRSDPSIARFARLLGICHKIKWTDHRTPATGNDETDAALEDLAEFLFLDAVADLATQGGEE